MNNLRKAVIIHKWFWLYKVLFILDPLHLCCGELQQERWLQYPNFHRFASQTTALWYYSKVKLILT